MKQTTSGKRGTLVTSFAWQFVNSFYDQCQKIVSQDFPFECLDWSDHQSEDIQFTMTYNKQKH